MEYLKNTKNKRITKLYKDLSAYKKVYIEQIKPFLKLAKMAIEYVIVVSIPISEISMIFFYSSYCLFGAFTFSRGTGIIPEKNRRATNRGITFANLDKRGSAFGFSLREWRG